MLSTLIMLLYLVLSLLCLFGPRNWLLVGGGGKEKCSPVNNAMSYNWQATKQIA